MPDTWKKEQKVTPFQALWLNTSQISGSIQKGLWNKEWTHCSVLEEPPARWGKCINVCSEVDLSQIEGDKAVRYFHPLWIYLPTVWRVFRGGKHIELPQKWAGAPSTRGVSWGWGYPSSSFQLFATAASKGSNAQFHLLSYSHFDSSVWMSNSFLEE